MLTTKLSDTNYRAKIVALPAVRSHPNADRLNLTTVDFQTVIVSKDAVPGTLYVYFPLECQINSEFLSFTNNFSDGELNRDKDKRGFFDKRGRVRATRLRQILSEGYMHPVESVNEWLRHKCIRYEITEKDIGVEFDSFGDTSFGDTSFVRKYVNPNTTKKSNNVVSNKKVKKDVGIVDGQFRVHEDTENLKRNVFKISPDDLISIRFKLHGCCSTFSNVLCKRKLSLVERIAKFFGAKIIESEYSNIWSSRRVIKTPWACKNSQSFYDIDIWTIVKEQIKDKIGPGYSIYGEIVGYLPNGKMIQPSYDYGCETTKHDFYVFRITYTTPGGEVIELNAPQIEGYCTKYGLKTAPLFYFGYAKDLFELKENEHWHENFLEKLKETYNEKPCYICKNHVPEEGVVLRKENAPNYVAFKLKSQKFLEGESKSLDKGEENIED